MPVHRRLARGPRDPRDPRRREPHAVPRLPRRVVQAVGVRVLGGRRRRRRRALRSAGRHHQPERVRADQLDRSGDLGGGGRPRHALRRRRSARCSSTTPRRTSPARCPKCGSTRSARSSCWSPCSCPRGIIGPDAGPSGGADERDADRDRRCRPRVTGRWREMRDAAARRAPPQLLGKILYLEASHRQLRRLQGAQRADALRRPGRAALHHRPERRRQDDHDGRHHRQDAPGRGLGVVRPERRTCWR